MKRMKATELRIGNTVFVDWVDAGRKIETCFGIHQGPDHDEPMMSTVTKGYWVPISKVRPIPLTEEWLVKFGGTPLYQVKRSKELNEKYAAQLEKGELQFEYHEKAYAYRLNMELIVLHYTGFNGSLGPVMEVGDRKVVLKYVHQLQNLYFALTGEELRPQ